MDTNPPALELAPSEIPDAVNGLLATLEAAGHASFVVGGGVRDLLCGRRPEDFDIATAAPVDALLELFPRAIPIGLKHGTVMVPSAAGPVDISHFRGDAGIEEDLALRDFTINAMAWHPGKDELLDPYDGRTDLTRRRLCAVLDADARFAEDPLRVLRGVRLAAELALEIPEPLLEAMRRAAPRLSDVANERIRYELRSLLLAPAVADGLRWLRASGIEAQLAPGARSDAPELVAALPEDFELRLAAWLRGTRSTAILRNLRFSRRVNQAVEHLLRWHPIDEGVDPSRESNVRRHMKRVGPGNVERLLLLRRAEIETQPGARGDALRALEAGIARVEAAGRVALQRHDLAIDGTEVMATLGLGPGRHVGQALSWLTECVLEDPAQNTPERLRALLANFSAEPTAAGGNAS